MWRSAVLLRRPCPCLSTPATILSETTPSSRSTPPQKPPMRGAVAGMMLLGSVVMFAAIGLGIGALLDAQVPALLVGLFLGFAAGTWAVATRFRDI